MKRLAFLAAPAILALIGCPNVVIVPGETSNSTGAGGVDDVGAQTGVTSTGAYTTDNWTTGTWSTGTGTPPDWDGCPNACTVAPGLPTCACAVGCEGESRISCSRVVNVQGESKIECTCSVGPDFSGVCFEENPSATCDPHRGCCFKYFQNPN